MDTSAFPERLEPFRVRPAPLTGADFTIPQWGGKVRSTEGGMYLLSQAAVERHGVRTHSNVSRLSSSIFPLVGQLSAIQAVTVPEADKVQLCIPPAAKWFAWSYPCSDHVKLAPVDETDASAMCAACTPLHTPRTPAHSTRTPPHTPSTPHPLPSPLHHTVTQRSSSTREASSTLTRRARSEPLPPYLPLLPPLLPLATPLATSPLPSPL